MDWIFFWKRVLRVLELRHSNSTRCWDSSRHHWVCRDSPRSTSRKPHYQKKWSPSCRNILRPTPEEPFEGNFFEETTSTPSAARPTAVDTSSSSVFYPSEDTQQLEIAHSSAFRQAVIDLFAIFGLPLWFAFSKNNWWVIRGRLWSFWFSLNWKEDEHSWISLGL